MNNTYQTNTQGSSENGSINLDRHEDFMLAQKNGWTPEQLLWYRKEELKYRVYVGTLIVMVVAIVALLAYILITVF